jgi:copper transport protein
MIRRAMAATAFATVLLLVLAGPASAHADLVRSDPANGATLGTAPTDLHLTFSETPDASLSAVDLLDAGGAKQPVGAPSPDGTDSLIVPIDGTLADGVYTVAWRVVSSDDGHVTSGAFTFGVGTTPTEPAAGPTTTASGPSPLGVASKALLYAGAMLLLAIAAVGIGVFHDAPRARRWLGVVAGALAAVGALGFLVAQQRAIGVSMTTYLDSTAGRDPVWTAIIALAALAFALAAWRSSRGWPAVAAGVLAAGVLALRAHGGHAAASATPVLAELLQWLHMLAAACWAGGLLLLVLVVAEHRADPPLDAARRYSAMAVASIAVVVGSGLVRAVAELGGLNSVTAAWDTSYGRALVIKVALVIGIVTLGAWNRLRGVDRLASDARPLRRVAATELVAIAGVLVLTATLTSLAPPVGAATAPTAGASDAVVLTGSDFATTVTVSLTVTPGQPGANLYRATVWTYATQTPSPAESVTLRLRSVTRPTLPGTTVRLRPDADAWVAQALDPAVAGTFDATVEVRAGASVAAVPLVLITRSDGAVTTTPGPAGERIAVGTYAGGVRLQASTSAGSPTQIHLTAFATDGTELPLREVALVVTPTTGAPQRLGVDRFSAGHVAATADLAAGTWTFDAVATARDGRTYQLTWQAPAG